MGESSSTGGYYHHEFVRTTDGWKSATSSRNRSGSSTPQRLTLSRVRFDPEHAVEDEGDRRRSSASSPSQ